MKLKQKGQTLLLSSLYKCQTSYLNVIVNCNCKVQKKNKLGVNLWAHLQNRSVCYSRTHARQSGAILEIAWHQGHEPIFYEYWEVEFSIFISNHNNFMGINGSTWSTYTIFFTLFRNTINIFVKYHRRNLDIVCNSIFVKKKI